MNGIRAHGRQAGTGESLRCLPTQPIPYFYDSNINRLVFPPCNLETNHSSTQPDRLSPTQTMSGDGDQFIFLLEKEIAIKCRQYAGVFCNVTPSLHQVANTILVLVIDSILTALAS